MRELVFAFLLALALLAPVDVDAFERGPSARQTKLKWHPDAGKVPTSQRIADARARFAATKRDRIARKGSKTELFFRGPNSTTVVRNASPLVDYNLGDYVQPWWEKCRQYDSSSCGYGWINIENVFCMRCQNCECMYDWSIYSQQQQLGIGSLAMLLNDFAGGDDELQCAEDALMSFEALFDMLQSFFDSSRAAEPPSVVASAVKPKLTTAISDIMTTVKVCFKVEEQSIWEKIIGWLKTVVEVIFPEVKVVEMVYELFVNGASIVSDIEVMLQVCQTNQGFPNNNTDMVVCGARMADVAYTAYEAILMDAVELNKKD
jgi:hypothetical protein